MKKILAIVPVLCALACGGEGPTPPPELKCSSISTTTYSFTVNKGETVTISYTSNCQSVRATASATGFPITLSASGSFSFTASENMTVVLTGMTSGKPGASATVTVNVIIPPPPSLKFSAPNEATLNQTIHVPVLKTNIKFCSPDISWNSSGKEFENTVPPTWDGYSFSPGSTMPVGKRAATLKLVCTGLDGSTISDSAIVGLVVPKLEVDSISPSTRRSGQGGRTTFYGRNNTFVSSNGVDFRGTAAVGAYGNGAPPPDSIFINGGKTFTNPNVFWIGEDIVAPVGSKHNTYIKTIERPEPPLVFLITIVP